MSEFEIKGNQATVTDYGYIAESASVANQGDQNLQLIQPRRLPNEEGGDAFAGTPRKPDLPFANPVDIDAADVVDAELNGVVTGGADADTVQQMSHNVLSYISAMPPEEGALFMDAYMKMESQFNGFLDMSPSEAETMVLLLNLLLVLAKASSEMKQVQRNASFASMKEAVNHLVTQAEKIKEGATIRFGTAVAGSALALGANVAGAGYIANKAFGSAGNVGYTYTQFAQMSVQAASQPGEITKNAGDFTNALKDAEGRIEASESQEDTFDSDQFKDLGGTTREVISSSISNIREAISAYRSALDHTSGNIA